MRQSGQQSQRLHDSNAPAARPFPAVTAHAGSLGTPDNTPASFEAALALPVDYLEADVRFSPQNGAYLAHDVLPPLPQARAMKLEELLKLAARHATVALNLDLKEYSGLREMARLIRETGMAQRVLLTGVTRSALSRVRDDAPGLAYLLNAVPGPLQRFTPWGAAALCRVIRACGARGLNVHHFFHSRCLARALAKAGLSASVWTVNGVREMRRMIRLSVDNITTRRIDVLLSMRNGRGA